MTRPHPTPGQVVERLAGRVPGLGERTAPEPSTSERILDAALAAFSRQGIRATTVTEIARDAGISREWLYKHYPSRDAIVVAVTQREIARFIDHLAVGASQAADFAGAVTDAFVFSVEFLRDNELVRQIRLTEPEVFTGSRLHGTASVVDRAVGAATAYIGLIGDLDEPDAAFVADTLIRLILSIVAVPRSAVDLYDGAELRSYAARLVPAVIEAALRPPAAGGERSAGGRSLL